LSIPIDWLEVSAWAAMITAIGALIAIWLQNRSEAITRSLDMLLRLEEKFDSERMRTLRKATAQGLLEGKLADEAYYVLDFFEEIGLLLRYKAIHVEILFESFYHSPQAYWFSSLKYINEMRVSNKEMYDNFEYLVERELDYASRKTGISTAVMKNQDFWKSYIVRETKHI